MLMVPPDTTKNLLTWGDLKSQKRMMKNTSRRTLVREGVRTMVSALDDYSEMHSADESLSHLVIPFVGVLPAFQGKGIGEKLLTLALDWADSASATSDAVVFHITQVHFLQRYGFAVKVQEPSGKYFIVSREPPREELKKPLVSGGSDSSSPDPR